MASFQLPDSLPSFSGVLSDFLERPLTSDWDRPPAVSPHLLNENGVYLELNCLSQAYLKRFSKLSVTRTSWPEAPSKAKPLC